MNRTIILALSLAVVLLAATASTASTTPTSPAPPLTLSVNGAHVGQRHENLKFGRGDKKTLYFGVITSNDSTLVLQATSRRPRRRSPPPSSSALKGLTVAPRGSRRMLL
jgi:hypothetical protein